MATRQNILRLFLVALASGMVPMAFAASPVSDGHVAPRLGQELRVGHLPQVLDDLRNDPERMSTLARIALDEMMRVYDAELDRVESELRDNPEGKAERYTWYRGALQTRNDLGRLRQSLTESTVIDVIAEAGGNTRLMVGGESVMIDSPRLDAKFELEELIAEQVCEAFDCSQSSSERQAPPGRQTPSSGNWSFSDRHAPTYDYSSGVQCTFQDNMHLQLKKQTCERMLAELNLLLDGLNDIHERGEFIDWQGLKILPSGGGASHRVVVDRQGDYLELPLPGLYRLDASLGRIRDWLRARLQDQPSVLELRLDNAIVYATAAVGAEAR
jgi:hypothetical protein